MKPRTEYKDDKDFRDSVGDGETMRPLDSPVSEKAQTERSEKDTSEKYSENPEKRTPIALEITSSPVEYYRILKGIKHIYVRPLKSSLNSNRAIASYQNVQIIFTDLMMICDISNLQELLLLPGRRIQEYVTLLSWFECHTPKSHQDRADLANSIQYLKVLNKHIQEVIVISEIFFSIPLYFERN
ncbi:unnamed protein product [Mytilus edulis]|uniref:DH domain-containing protein n=1 Tax=Mytilus edulis TaxID=6550 RepID=A0A8S3UW20_MYTED|nr:unnamed protein product [Mytilus edulis]